MGLYNRQHTAAATGGADASRTLYTGSYADPNVHGLVPDDPTQGAAYYQDPDITLYNEWKWSFTRHLWFQTSTP